MANGDRGYRAAPLTDAELASGKLDLRVFVDRGSVEVYVNGGHQALSCTPTPPKARAPSSSSPSPVVSRWIP